MFGQICADELGVDVSSVTVVGGDTDTIERGWGTVASRSAGSRWKCRGPMPLSL